jgi:choline dehydrogenase-like flavoprotein
MKRQPRGLSPGMHHGLAFNDFYLRDGVKLGNVHIHPVPVTRDAVLSFMRLHLKRMAGLPSAVQRAAAAAGAYVARSGFGMATIVEDLPYTCNRVLPRAASLDGIAYEYRYPHELRVRSWTLLQHVRESLKEHFFVRLARPAGLLNVSHACGTCRFGDNPETSVLDRDNRTHDLDNLYVVDASFFPSSGGINPSLTIVANSLRVGELIDRRL